jgi:SAM-dependent methyltransferase
MPVEILRCPVTGSGLRVLSDAERAELNAQIASGGRRTRGGALVEQPLDAGLLGADGRFAYAVDDGIAVLLPDRAIVLDSDAPDEDAGGRRSEKEAVEAFYDEVGWKQTEDDVFEDTARFVDTRPIVQEYNRECRRRIGRALPAGGEYLLDVASGPVQFPEYVDYQSGFRRRVCVDLSKLALVNAGRNVGDKAVLVQGDITALPFQDGTIDAVLSLHTIYHVPADEQPRAFLEIHRVLKPGGIAVVAYSWGATPWAELSAPRKLANLPVRLLRRLTREVSRRRRGEDGEPLPTDEPSLYWHAYDYRWFKRQRWPFRAEVRVHHVFSSGFLERYIRGPVIGGRLLAAIRWTEDRFPRLAGRFGLYPLIIINKD